MNRHHGELTGTGALVRLIVRRDRVRLPVWVLGIGLTVVAAASSLQELYPTAAELASAFGRISDNTAIIALRGPPVGLDTAGGAVAFQLSAVVFVVTALMNIFLVTRHTRAEEETGRAELVRAGAVGRRAPITAALLVAAAADLLVGLIVAGGLVALGLGATGAVALGSATAAVGAFFGGVTAVTAQISERGREASGLAVAVVGASYVLRALGDTGNGVLSWCSPLGWGQAVRAYAGERWWALLLPVAGTVVLVVGAYALAAHRDVGAGMLRQRAGPAQASASLGGPLGLAARLERGTVIAWGVGLLILGAVYGSIAHDIADLIGDNEQLREIIARQAGSVTDSFFATTLLILSLIGTGFAVQATLRLHTEEGSGHAEVVLAAAVSRTRWAGGHLAVAIGGSAIVLAAAGLGEGVAAAIGTTDAAQVPRLLGAALVHLPAVAVFVGLAMALFGLVPRAVLAVWAVLAVCLVLGMFGDVLGLPQWLRDLSPFEHVPQLPASSFDPVPVLALTAVAAALVAAGLAGLRSGRRLTRA